MEYIHIIVLLTLVSWGCSYPYFEQKVKKFKKGKYCVYNSECYDCQFGLSRWCRANTCFCQDNTNPFHHRDLGSDPFTLRARAKELCNVHSQNSPLSVYYDSAMKKCIEQKYITSFTVTSCPAHMILISHVDGRSYCANQISPFDISCAENHDCDVLFSDDYLAWCRSGYCHAMSVINKTAAILSRDNCDHNELSYCKEIGYKHTNVTVSRISYCRRQCERDQFLPGIPITWLDSCICLQTLGESSREIIFNPATTKQKYITMISTGVY